MKISITGTFGGVRLTAPRAGGFNANTNHPPKGDIGAITSDRGLELLRRIAGVGY